MTLSPHVAIWNRSTVVSDADTMNAMLALQYQTTHHFAPHYHTSALYSFFSAAQVPPANYWQLAILDNSDQAGALGYHDMTSAGLPLGKIFAKTDLQYGDSWSVTLSHEALEMLADPDICRTAVDYTSTKVYAFEVADACEADKFGYLVNGVLLSDFVLPPWFSGAPPPYDYKALISKPFQLLSGGYISVMDASGLWTQVVTRDAEQDTPPVGSRRERRMRGRYKWKSSASR